MQLEKSPFAESVFASSGYPNGPIVKKGEAINYKLGSIHFQSFLNVSVIKVISTLRSLRRQARVKTGLMQVAAGTGTTHLNGQVSGKAGKNLSAPWDTDGYSRI